ncbi:MAG: hypothetical protein K9M80_03520 [Candidatus Marinimicrobia bacterium]|nr:hypothetical protein [Candidatus Neomarinimicrobiota bacterium]
MKYEYEDFYDNLSQADKNSICDSRGIPKKIAKSKKLFLKQFLTDKGVDEALESLDPLEYLGIFVIAHFNNDYKVDFFKKIYDYEPAAGFDATFNQRYKDLFKVVRKNLIRKGLLGFYHSRSDRSAKSKLEKSVFYVPFGIADKLSFPFQTKQLNEKSWKKHRKYLLEGIMHDFYQNIDSQAGIKDGDLYHNSNPFKSEYLISDWIDYWQDCIDAPDWVYFNSQKFYQILHFLGMLPDGSWLREKDFDRFLEILLYNNHNTGAIEKRKGGIISKILFQYSENDQVYYQATPNLLYNYNIEEPGSWHQKNEQALIINLENTAPHTLKEIAMISDFKISQNRLIATPSFIKMGRLKKADHEFKIISWLINNYPFYQEIFEEVKQQRGSELVHTNIKIAKIDDIRLKAILEKKFGDSSKVVFLDNNYIVFLSSLLSRIEKLLQQEGLSIKRV